MLDGDGERLPAAYMWCDGDSADENASADIIPVERVREMRHRKDNNFLENHL